MYLFHFFFVLHLTIFFCFLRLSLFLFVRLLFVGSISVSLFMRVRLFVDGIDGRNNPVVFVGGDDGGDGGVRIAYDGRNGTKTS